MAREIPITKFRPRSRLRDLAMRADLDRSTGNRNGRVDERELDAFDRGRFHGFSRAEIDSVREAIRATVGRLLTFGD